MKEREREEERKEIAWTNRRKEKERLGFLCMQSGACWTLANVSIRSTNVAKYIPYPMGSKQSAKLGE